jgi:shikimate kinase
MFRGMGGRTTWLVGMMGAGKSAVGRALAARRGCAFVDTDERVEREAGATVAEIFAREGEAGFRRRERAAIEAVAGRDAVVALGGGAIAQPGVAARLRESGTVVYLRARPETLLARLGDACERPLLAGLDARGRRGRLAQLLAEREACYGRAHATVDTDALDVEAACAAVERALAALAPQATVAEGGPAGQGAR